MTLPIDIVLVRHGQSEGNAAKRRLEAGDDSTFTKAFMNRHTSSFRLTDLGREQARQAGEFIKSEFFKDGVGFDRYITSEYIRAMETAGLLKLPHAQWFCEFYLAERNWGELELGAEHDGKGKFADVLRRLENEPFFVGAPVIESSAQHCLRTDRVLDTLHRECSNKRVLIVCHGESMITFQMRIERMSHVRFKELIQSKKTEDRIYNGQIIHYSRRNPKDNSVAPYMEWVRWIRPTDTPITLSGWKKIKRPRYSNEDLLKVVESHPLIIK